MTSVPSCLPLLDKGITHFAIWAPEPYEFNIVFRYQARDLGRWTLETGPSTSKIDCCTQDTRAKGRSAGARFSVCHRAKLARQDQMWRLKLETFEVTINALIVPRKDVPSRWQEKTMLFHTSLHHPVFTNFIQTCKF